MPFRNIEQLPKTGKILCLDVGKKTLGVAISDKTRLVATPYPTIRRKKWGYDKEIIAKYIKENEIEVFVVGWPILKDGTKSPITDMTESFADTLEKEFGLPVMLVDESYSTNYAEEVIKEAGVSRKKAKQKALDSIAASFILQKVLDLL